MIRRFLVVALLLIPARLMADTGDIPLSSNFQLNSGRPLDAKFVSADATARNAIPGILRYDGMLVYQRSDHQMWQLQGGTSTWVHVVGSGTAVDLLPLDNQWTGANTWTTVEESTFTAGVAARTFRTIPALGDNDSGGVDGKEGLEPAGLVGIGQLWFSSTTHRAYLKTNNGVSYLTALSSGVLIPNHLVMASDDGVIKDFGPAPWVIFPSTFPMVFNFPVVFNSTFTIQGGSATIDAPLSIIHRSTETVSSLYYDASLSSTTLGRVQAANGYGSPGYILTKVTDNQPVAWSVPGCIPLTRAAIQAITPGRLGECYSCTDCTTATLCVSSGTASANQFYSSASRAAGCL